MALATAAGPTGSPLINQTIGENLEATVARFGDREALVVPHQGIRYTYTEFNDAVDTVARGLLARDLGVGDRLGIWSPNNAEWVLVQYATAKIGAIMVNINPAYRTSELEYTLNQSECRFLISARNHLKSDYMAMIDEVRPKVPGLEEVIYLDSPDWEDLIAAADSVPAESLREIAAGLSADQPINIQYTSGTTGFPKGATLSHYNILNNGFFVGEACGYDETDRVCIPVPFYHCFGMVLGNLACTTHGSAIVVPGASFDPKTVLETVEREACTSLYGVPTMFIAELAHDDFDDYDLGTLRTGIMAGSPCPVEVMKRVISDMHMDEVTIAYGMTETSPVSTQTGTDDDVERKVSTVGQVHPHIEVKITDPDTGETVERGERGELCTRGYSVMLGYWNDADRTAEAIDTDAWMHTGDLATMDADGYVNIVGRIKDMIIRGGENVYPREIEEYLYTHPDIVDAQVIGIPDEKYGEQVMAWVQVKPGRTLTEEDVKEFCRSHIAHFKVPAHVAFVDEYPMTVTGKIQKFKLREMAIKDLGLESAAEVVTA
jgi:fatty-acyl-CoA synthase